MAVPTEMTVEIQPVEGRLGAVATFPYDRLTVERFRQAFPSARWSDELRAWVAPGKAMPGVLIYADERGRDVFSFEPIESELT